jgi:hypothetical protein
MDRCGVMLVLTFLFVNSNILVGLEELRHADGWTYRTRNPPRRF